MASNLTDICSYGEKSMVEPTFGSTNFTIRIFVNSLRQGRNGRRNTFFIVLQLKATFKTLVWHFGTAAAPF